MCHHAKLIFVFLVEMGFHHVGQAGLEHLNLSDPPASASQIAGITGMSHRARPGTEFLLGVSLSHELRDPGQPLLSQSCPDKTNKYNKTRTWENV